MSTVLQGENHEKENYKKKKITRREYYRVSSGDSENPYSLKVLKVKIDIKKLRKALGLTQKEFAETYGFNLETLRKWEQGLYTPDQGVTSYLSCISKKPDAIKKI